MSENLQNDMARLRELANVDAVSAAELINEFCDSLLNEDVFGTEGQCDPRGDNRSGDVVLSDRLSDILVAIDKMESFFQKMGYSYHETLAGMIDEYL